MITTEQCDACGAPAMFTFTQLTGSLFMCLEHAQQYGNRMIVDGWQLVDDVNR